MNYNVIQNAITKQTQEQFPDGIISKVGNDKYTKEEARDNWHTQCHLLTSDADTLLYTCAVVDSQLNIVDGLYEFKDKRQNPEPEA